MGVPAAVGAAAWLPEIAGRAEEKKNAEEEDGKEEGGRRVYIYKGRGAFGFAEIRGFSNDL